MKKATLFILPLLLLISACANKKALVNSPANDGSSYDKAIFITEKYESQGVDAEYKWIAKTYPGAKTYKQVMAYHEKKPYDILYITTPDGKEITVYFDISNFYGKL